MKAAKWRIVVIALAVCVVAGCKDVQSESVGIAGEQRRAAYRFLLEKLKEENTLSRMQKLDYIILNAPFLNSYFIEDVRKMRALEAIYNIPVSQNGSFTTETENQTDSISF